MSLERSTVAVSPQGSCDAVSDESGPVADGCPGQSAAPSVYAGKRIAFVINQLTYGGAETQLSLLARGFARRGWRVEVFTVREPQALTTDLQAAGVRVHTINLPYGRPAWFGTLWLIRELRRFQPDVIHSHMYRPNIWARLLRPFVRPPVLVCTAHNTFEGDTMSDRPGLAERLYRFTDRLCDLTTNVSQVAVDRYRRLRAAPSDRIRLVYNGIDTERFAPDVDAGACLREELALGDAPVVLAIGRIEPQKNYPLLLEAFSRVRERHPDARLLIVGEGNDEEALARLVERMDFGDSVRLLGVRDDIHRLMNAADLYVMSSDWEGLPIVLLEASATGLPMVVTDVGGNSEIVRDGESGHVVPPGNREALAQAMTRVLSMPATERQQMGAAARRHIEREFGIDRVLNQWESIFGELMRRRPSWWQRIIGWSRRDEARPRPRILTDSDMWQSETWSREVNTVFHVQSRSRFARVLNHPVMLGLRLFARGWRYDTVVTTGTKGSIVYGVLCRLTLRQQRQVMTQLYLDPPRGMLKPVQDSLIRFMLRGAHGVLIPSRGEASAVHERFGLPLERMRYVPFHTNVIHPQDRGCDSGPVFAGGRNYRDYETLIEAVRGTDIELVVVCGGNQLRETHIPPNVTVYRELPYEQYLELMRQSSAVVIPLTSTTVPSGHSSILEGMAYGKPVITVDAPGTVDYVRHGIDGMLYRSFDSEDLRARILELTSDDGLRRRMGRAAYESVMESFTFEIHAAAKLAAIRELARTQ